MQFHPRVLARSFSFRTVSRWGKDRTTRNPHHSRSTSCAIHFRSLSRVREVNVKVGVDDVLNPHAREDATEQTLPQYEFIGNSLTSPIDNIFYNVDRKSTRLNN